MLRYATAVLVIVVGMGLYAPSVLSGQSDLSIQVRPLTVGAGSIAFFPVGEEDSASPATSSELTEKGLFKVAVEYQDLHLGVDRRTLRYYDFYVQQQSTGALHHFRFRGQCTGAIADGWPSVTVDVSAGAKTDLLTTSIPVACGSLQGGLVPSDKAADIQTVDISGPGRVTVRVRNTTDVDLNIQAHPSIDASGQVWQKAPQLDTAVATRVKSGDWAELVIDVLPNRLEAAKVSFFGIRPEQEHVSIPVRVDYSNPAIRDRDGHLEQTVRIRFRPVIPYVLLCLAFGILLGSVARLSLPAQRGSARDWLESSGRAAVVAFVVWLVGLFMVQFGSNFELFHFRLDPWQTFPTLVIGLLLGFSGDESVAALKRLLHLDEPAKASSPN